MKRIVVESIEGKTASTLKTDPSVGVKYQKREWVSRQEPKARERKHCTTHEGPTWESQGKKQQKRHDTNSSRDSSGEKYRVDIIMIDRRMIRRID